MQLRRLLLALVGAVVTVLALDRVLSRLASPLAPSVAGRPDTVRSDGSEVAIVEMGPPDADPVVFVHGPHLGASSREFAALIDELDDDRHLIVLDLPGFGRSDRPHVPYTLERQAAAIAAVIDDRASSPPVVVTSGQALPAAAMAADRSEVARLVAIGPRVARRRTRPELAAVLSLPVVDTATYLFLTAGPLLRRHLQAVYECTAAGLPAGLDAYAWQSAYQSGSRGAITAWVAGDLDVPDDLTTVVTDTADDVAFVVGEAASHPTVEAVRTAASETDASVSVVSATGAMAHVTEPGAVAEHLERAGLLE